jgi:hypothetical protein
VGDSPLGDLEPKKAKGKNDKPLSFSDREGEDDLEDDIDEDSVYSDEDIGSPGKDLSRPSLLGIGGRTLIDPHNNINSDLEGSVSTEMQTVTSTSTVTDFETSVVTLDALTSYHKTVTKKVSTTHLKTVTEPTSTISRTITKKVTSTEKDTTTVLNTITSESTETITVSETVSLPTTIYNTVNVDETNTMTVPTTIFNTVSVPTTVYNTETVPSTVFNTVLEEVTITRGTTTISSTEFDTVRIPVTEYNTVKEERTSTNIIPTTVLETVTEEVTSTTQETVTETITDTTSSQYTEYLPTSTTYDSIVTKPFSTVYVSTVSHTVTSYITDFKTLTDTPALSIVGKNILPTTGASLRFGNVPSFDVNSLLRKIYMYYDNNQLSSRHVNNWCKKIEQVTKDIGNQIKLFRGQDDGKLLYNPFEKCTSVSSTDVLIKHENKLFRSTLKLKDLILFRPSNFCFDYCLVLDSKDYIGEAVPPTMLAKIISHDEKSSSVVIEDDTHVNNADICLKDNKNRDVCTYRRLPRQERTLLYNQLVLLCKENEKCVYQTDSGEFFADTLVSQVMFDENYVTHVDKLLSKIMEANSKQTINQTALTGIFFGVNFLIVIVYMVVRNRYRKRIKLNKRKKSGIKALKIGESAPLELQPLHCEQVASKRTRNRLVEELQNQVSN